MYTIVEETEAPAVSDLIADLLDESSTVEQVEQEASTRLLTADYVASNQDEVVDLTELLKEETKAVEAAEAVAAAQAAERARREAEAKAAAEAAARATAESEAATEKAGFFKRLFGRKKKS
jgi:membrane protein involved in colicin uptake